MISVIKHFEWQFVFYIFVSCSCLYYIYMWIWYFVGKDCLSPHVNLCVTFIVYDYTYMHGNIDLPSDDEDDFCTNAYIFFIRYHRWPYIPIKFFLEENVQNSKAFTSPDISSHSSFLENYLFVQTPSSKFDHLPNSASTPKTHKTIVKYNMEKLGACRKFSGYIRENGTNS